VRVALGGLRPWFVVEVAILFVCLELLLCFFFSSRRRHTRSTRDWSSDVCSSDLRSTGRKLGSLETTRSWRHFVRYPMPSSIIWRSEERRVGKECRSGWSPDQ